MHHSLLHPCAHEGGLCCGNSAYAPFLLRYESFFHSRHALLVLAYEVCSWCAVLAAVILGSHCVTDSKHITPGISRTARLLHGHSYKHQAGVQPAVCLFL